MRAGFYFFVGVLAFTFLSAPVSRAAVAQRTQELTGQVVNEKAYPIGGVTCRLTGGMLPSEGITVTTDPLGKFSVRGLLPGRYDLTCTALGYTPFVRTGLVVTAAGIAPIHAVMPTLKKALQKVEVSAAPAKVAEQGSAPPTKLGAQELTTLPIAEQKFKAALPLVPGVIRSPTGKINIKGAVENQGMLLVDGAQASDPVTGSFDIDLSIDAIQSLNVYKAPFSPQYSGFSGGLTTIETKAPSYKWGWDLNDFFPGFRGRSGHLVGVNDWEPRLDFTGPLWKHNLSFSEAFIYDLLKIPVRGLAWPHNETKKESYNSFTTLQYVVSPHHLMSFYFHLFPQKQEYANISALVHQPNSSNYSERGFSVQANDSYQFSSGGILSTLFNYTKFDADAWGQGPEPMLLTPDGYGGNYFNIWRRASDQEEGDIMYRFPAYKWLGTHQFDIGGDLINGSYTGISQSHPIFVTRQNGTFAEQINFLGPGGIPTSQVPASLSAQNAQGAAFVGDHWMVNDHAALELGLQYYGQAVGQLVTFAPRFGLVFSPSSSGRTVIRSGVGVFKSRIPLLASDFDSNPTQMITLFDSQGNVLGAPITYQNRCATRTPTGLQIVPDCSDLDATPYNLTWQVELDHQITSHVAVKFSYLQSGTFRDFVINPVETSPSEAMLLLANRGAARYHEFETLVSYRDEKGNELNTSYVRSRSRGDLNSITGVFVPFQEPFIRPDAYANLDADVPNRFISWGIFHLPFKIVFAPIIDWHTGFPWSTINDLQNYVGVPNGRRFPGFFSFDFKVWKRLPLPHFLPFGLGGSKLRWGIGFHNATNALDPLAVYNNIASPYYGHFVGFQHRVIDINVDTGR
ncbi:MAG: carboxypeptidase regulatory-like domain-containing protein [Acidobacteria bacterium]|nr:carboxypeptidase regulatory-like domain-containing protein [Acidobacteriota bacterium]